MPSLMSRYATPFVTGLFLVSLVSGVALFFHWQTAWFHSMHEILSLVLIVPFVLHVWKNWTPFKLYLRRAPMAVALALSLAASLAFAMPAMMAGGSGGGSPQAAVFDAIGNASLAVVAPLFGHTGESLAEGLKAAGFTVASVDDTLDAIARASARDERAAIMAVVALKR